jgi:hypothetical protein
MNRVIALMPDSESPLVALAGEHLGASLYRPDGQSVVTFQLRDGSPAKAGENPNLSMGIGLGAPNGETVNLLIMPTIQRVLTDTPQGLSNQLVHEDKHMEQFQRTLDTVKQEKLPVQIKQALLAQDLRMYWNEKEAEMCRKDDMANVLCLPSDYIDRQLAEKIVKVWLETAYSTESRHMRRVKKISALEN